MALVPLVPIVGCNDINEAVERANQVEVLRWKGNLKAGHTVVRDDFDSVSVDRAMKEKLNLVSDGAVNVTMIVGRQLVRDVQDNDLVRFADLVDSPAR